MSKAIKLSKLTEKKANLIARRYISAIITYYDCFDSAILNNEENEMIQNECMKVALKLYNGQNNSQIDKIVIDVLKTTK